MTTEKTNGKPRFTPTEERLLAVLGDGEPHNRAELVACLWVEGSEWRNVNPHLVSLRKKVREEKKVIVCQVVNRRFMYRMLALLPRG
jgi:hypothetical protein